MLLGALWAWQLWADGFRVVVLTSQVPGRLVEGETRDVLV